MFHRLWLFQPAGRSSGRAHALGTAIMRAALSAVGLLLVLVTGAGTLNPSPFGPTAPIRLTEQDAGRTIEVRAGNHVDIVLDDYTTSGHGWEQVQANYQVVSIFHPAYTRNWGGGGRTWFAVTADQPGRSRITIAHDAAPNQPPIAPFTVELIVR